MERELHFFEMGSTATAQAEAFSELIKLKQHHRAAKDPSSPGVEALAAG